MCTLLKIDSWCCCRSPSSLQGECVVLRDRKLNIAPAIKKQSLCATNGPVYYAATPPAPLNNIPIDQFAAVYPPGRFMGTNRRKRKPCREISPQSGRVVGGMQKLSLSHTPTWNPFGTRGHHLAAGYFVGLLRRRGVEAGDKAEWQGHVVGAKANCHLHCLLITKKITCMFRIPAQNRRASRCHSSVTHMFVNKLHPQPLCVMKI